MIKLLDKELYDIYENTYPKGDYKEIWNALMLMISLFREVATKSIWKKLWTLRKRMM